MKWFATCVQEVIKEQSKWQSNLIHSFAYLCAREM